MKDFWKEERRGFWALVCVMIATAIVVYAIMYNYYEQEPLIQSLDFGSDDAELLMKFAQAEIGDGDWENKGRLMLTILNRVWSPGYPDSIEEVIAQSEFASASDGLYLRAVPDKSCEIAIENIYHGWNESHNSLTYEPVHHMTEQEFVDRIVRITEISLALIVVLAVLSVIDLIVLLCLKHSEKKL